MIKVDDSFILNGNTVRNRFVMPPMVIYEQNSADGFVQQVTVNHYAKYASTGAGIVVVEATAVSPEARLSVNQLGLWNDSFIEGHANIAKAIKENGALALVQIHHAGLKSVDKKVTASLFMDGEIEVPALSINQIEEVMNQFVDAAVRAEKAGYNGIELHGAHGYLVSQFFSTAINHRVDAYGGSTENRARLATTIIEKIKAKVAHNFIIGVRMGCNDMNAVVYAKLLQQAGAHYLHCSYGYERNNIDKPYNFEGEGIHYKASLIKQAVDIPTIAVFKITTPQKAQNLIEAEICDMVAIGRSLLVDPEWFAEALAGKETVGCLNCKGCWWHQAKGNQCPGRKLWLKQHGQPTE